MLHLTSLELSRTAIGLVALGAGFVALFRDQEISPRTGIGRLYAWATVIAGLTGFGIFRSDEFGRSPVLGIIALAALGIAALAGKPAAFGRPSRSIATISYTATFFLHLFPVAGEAANRLSTRSDRDGGAWQLAAAALLAVFLLVAALQVLQLRRRYGQSGSKVRWQHPRAHVHRETDPASYHG